MYFNDMRSSAVYHHLVCRSDATHHLTYELRRNSRSVGHRHHPSVTAAVCGIHRRHVYDEYSVGYSLQSTLLSPACIAYVRNGTTCIIIP